MSKSNTIKPKRGTLLTIALVLVILHGLFMTAVYWTTLGNVGREAAPWVLPVMVLASLASVIAGAAMWFWKKWGIYLYFLAAVVTTVVTLIMTGSLYMVFAGLIPMIIVLYIIYPHLKHFD
jgi:hypothetical protein